MPQVDGLVETALYVDDIEKSAAFYERVFGFRKIFEESDRLCALSISDKQVLLLFRIGASRNAKPTKNGVIPPHDGSGTLHLAFAIPETDRETWREQLKTNGVEIESEVHCGGDSLYVRDPDGHLVELITPGCWSIY